MDRDTACPCVNICAGKQSHTHKISPSWGPIQSCLICSIHQLNARGKGAAKVHTEHICLPGQVIPSLAVVAAATVSAAGRGLLLSACRHSCQSESECQFLAG